MLCEDPCAAVRPGARAVHPGHLPARLHPGPCAGFGCAKVCGLHFQIVTVKTATCTPVIVATRLRKGSANSDKGAASLLREALTTVRAMGLTGQIIVRADSPYFSHKVVDVCRRASARFSLAVAVKKKVRETITQIPEEVPRIQHSDALDGH
ncbi:transposase [Streptomyces sp. 3N207]|uniref:transposase n=1 Tax=Streptomyces sp. 3N207 TaxID=3457417 RepID=UPI003FCF722A